MARIQVLPLTTVRADELETVTFAIVIDQIADDDGLTQADFEALKEHTGAATILAYEGALDVASPLVLTDEQKAALVAQLQV